MSVKDKPPPPQPPSRPSTAGSVGASDELSLLSPGSLCCCLRFVRIAFFRCAFDSTTGSSAVAVLLEGLCVVASLPVAVELADESR